MTERYQNRSSLLASAVAVALFAGLPGAVSAQDANDRWLAWMGCWQPTQQSTAEGAPEAMLCFQPTNASDAVEMLSIEDGEIAERGTVVANGSRTDATLEGCTGSETGQFASRPGRVYLSAEYVCDGGIERSTSGMLAMVSAEQFIDVKVVTVDGEKLTWITRYRLATQDAADAVGLGSIASDQSMAVRSARVAGTARPGVEDVIEASQYVDDDGVQAWLAERNIPLMVDSDRLIQLAEAGVSEDVIDMVVAVSFPERFAVDREAERYAGGYGRGLGGFGGGLGYYDPFYGSLFFSPFGYGYGYGYDRYGYGYGGRYYGPTIIRVDNRDNGGQVIAGQGYRRGSGTSSSPRVRQPTSSSRGGSSVGTRSSGGSRGTSTGRTARRRGGGGGGI